MKCLSDEQFSMQVIFSAVKFEFRSFKFTAGLTFHKSVRVIAYLTSFCMTSCNVKLTTTNGRLRVSLPTLPISKSIFFRQSG